MIYYKPRDLDKGESVMRKLIFVAVIAMFLCTGTAFAGFNPIGDWLFEGGGYAEKSFVRARLNARGELEVTTVVMDGKEYVTGYRVRANLYVSQFGFNVWKDSGGGDLRNPVPLPYLNPTMNNPFRLPRVTHEGLTYEVVFTSATSGTIRIYGYLDVDFVGNVEGDSASILWRKGSKKPDIPDMTSGCNAGFAAVTLLLFAFIFARALKKQK